MGCFGSKSPDPATLPQLLDSLPLQVRLLVDSNTVTVFQGSQVLRIFRPQCEPSFSANALQHFHRGVLYFCEVDPEKPSSLGGLEINSLVETEVIKLNVNLSGGILQSFGEHLIYCGGSSFDDSTEKPAPIIKYSCDTQRHELLQFEANLLPQQISAPPRINASPDSPESAIPEDDIETESRNLPDIVTPNDLVCPGACFDSNGFLYLVGGTYTPLDSQPPQAVGGEDSAAPEHPPPSEKAYLGVMKVDIDQNTYTELSAIIPFGIHSPYCVMLSDNEILVVGGRAVNKRKRPVVKRWYIIILKQGRIEPDNDRNKLGQLPCKLELGISPARYKKPYVVIYNNPNFLIFNTEVRKWYLMKIPSGTLETALKPTVAKKKIDKIQEADFFKFEILDNKDVSDASSQQASDIEYAEFKVSKSHFESYLNLFLEDFRITLDDVTKTKLLSEAPTKINPRSFKSILIKVVPLEHKFLIGDVEKHLESLQKLTGCQEFSKKHIKKLMLGKNKKLRWLNSVQGVDIVVKAYQSMQID